MQAISIAERLWLEPTLLGATLNFSDQFLGWHFRVGIGFRSLGECDQALQSSSTLWTLRDQSLRIEGTEELKLTFCPGTKMERHFILRGDEMEIFKQAIHFLSFASEPRLN